MTEAARGADDRKSLRQLKYRSKLGQKLIALLLEHLFDMVNRRHSVLSCRCWYDRRLGLLGVTEITMSVSVCACCVCVAYLSVQV